MMKRTTLDERAKMTGFLTGENSPIMRAHSQKMAEEPAAEDEDVPPNLEDKPTGKGTCGDCQHFAAKQCTLHSNYPVTANQGCDDFQEAGEGGEEEMMADEEAE